MFNQRVFLLVLAGSICSFLFYLLGKEYISAQQNLFDLQKKSRFTDDIRFKFFVFLLLTVCVLAVVFVGGSAITTSDTDAEALGQRGDFFGGTLNPILTFMTFLAFLYTIVLQRSDLKESRIQFERSADALSEQSESIRLQNYQASFFQLLATHNDIVSSISLIDPVTNNEKSGREAFQVVYSSIRRVYRDKAKRFPKAGKERALLFAYGSVYRNYQYQLGHYMRFLYNAIVLLQEGPVSEKYIKILRAQISNQELLVIFYNCVASEAGKNFKKLAECHVLFDNIPPHLLDDDHALLIDQKAFGVGGYNAIKKKNRPSIRGDLTVFTSAAKSQE